MPVLSLSPLNAATCNFAVPQRLRADVASLSIARNITIAPAPRSYAFSFNIAVSGIAKKIKRTVFTVVTARAAITIDHCVPLLRREKKKSRCIRLVALFADRFKWTLLATFPIRAYRQFATPPWSSGHVALALEKISRSYRARLNQPLCFARYFTPRA